MATSRLDRAPHQYLTLPEAAAYLGQSVKTLRRRISAGTLPAYRFGPRSIRVRLADLEATGHRVPNAAPMTDAINHGEEPPITGQNGRWMGAFASPQGTRRVADGAKSERIDPMHIRCRATIRNGH